MESRLQPVRILGFRLNAGLQRGYRVAVSVVRTISVQLDVLGSRRRPRGPAAAQVGEHRRPLHLEEHLHGLLERLDDRIALRVVEVGRGERRPVPSVQARGLIVMGGSSFPLPLRWWCPIGRVGIGSLKSGSAMGRTGPVPSREGSGAAKGRARLPLTSQVDAVGTSANSPGGRRSRSSSRPDRPSVSRSSRSGRPATTRCANRLSKAGKPGVVGASQATARCGRSARIDSTIEVRIAPGPTSTKTLRPVAVHRLDHVGEPDRPGEVVAQPRGDGRPLVGVGRGVDVGVHRPVGRPADPLDREAG